MNKLRKNLHNKYGGFFMNQEEYQKLVTKITPKPKKIKNALIAFGVGGLVGVLAETISKLLQAVFNISNQNANIWMLLIIIFCASLFTALHFFDDWVSFAKAGLIVPITGFAHSITSAALDYKKDGLITGLGSNFFKLAGSVLLYGIISSFFLVIIKVVLNV